MRERYRAAGLRAQGWGRRRVESSVDVEEGVVFAGSLAALVFGAVVEVCSPFAGIRLVVEVVSREDIDGFRSLPRVGGRIGSGWRVGSFVAWRDGVGSVVVGSEDVGRGRRCRVAVGRRRGGRAVGERVVVAVVGAEVAAAVLGVVVAVGGCCPGSILGLPWLRPVPGSGSRCCWRVSSGMWWFLECRGRRVFSLNSDSSSHV